MRRLIDEALDQGAIGFASSFSINHVGHGGIPMPSTIATVDEFSHLAEAVGAAGRGIVQMSAGGRGTVEAMEPVVEKIGRRMFLTTGAAMYNASDPERAKSWFADCAAAKERGNELYIQIPCQPLSFDFTMANAYPFFSHSAFDDIKAYSTEQLIPVFQNSAFRERFRENLETQSSAPSSRGLGSRSSSGPLRKMRISLFKTGPWPTWRRNNPLTRWTSCST